MPLGPGRPPVHRGLRRDRPRRAVRLADVRRLRGPAAAERAAVRPGVRRPLARGERQRAAVDQGELLARLAADPDPGGHGLRHVRGRRAERCPSVRCGAGADLRQRLRQGPGANRSGGRGRGPDHAGQRRRASAREARRAAPRTPREHPLSRAPDLRRARSPDRVRRRGDPDSGGRSRVQAGDPDRGPPSARAGGARHGGGGGDRPDGASGSPSPRPRGVARHDPGLRPADRGALLGVGRLDARGDRRRRRLRRAARPDGPPHPEVGGPGAGRPRPRRSRSTRRRSPKRSEASSAGTAFPQPA